MDLTAPKEFLNRLAAFLFNLSFQGDGHGFVDLYLFHTLSFGMKNLTPLNEISKTVDVVL